jgi:hypothetical protein
MIGIDAIVALAGLVLPPVVDFAKKKFLKPSSDSPEATMSSLATTNPTVLPEYVKATTEYLKAQTDYFNRDVVGTPALWVINLRASIRPFGVIGSLLILGAMALAAFEGQDPLPGAIDTLTGVRLTCELIVSSWFGTRIALSLKDN